MKVQSPMANNSINHACVCMFIPQLCLTLCDPVDCSLQAPLSVDFSRQEYTSGLPCPSPGDLRNSGTEPGSATLQADLYHLSHQGSLPSEISIKSP